MRRACSLPGSPVHGIFQASILEWIAISFSRGSSQPRAQTQVSCIVDRRFNVWATRETQKALIHKAFWKKFKNRNQSSCCQGWGSRRVLTQRDMGNFLGWWKFISWLWTWIHYSKHLWNSISHILKRVNSSVWTLSLNLNQIPYDFTVEVTNRFKVLDLIEFENLWMEVRDIV